MTWHDGVMPPAPRPVSTILDELAAIERHLVDAPPHAGAGQREDLARRATELRRELAAARRASGTRAGRTDP